MAEKRPEYTGDYVTCTITNKTTSKLTLYGQPILTGGSISGPVSEIEPNSETPVTVFKAEGPPDWPSGCGGQVTYQFTNGDLLVLLYNDSVNAQAAWCVPLLQGPAASQPGCSAFCCIASGCANPGGTTLDASIVIEPPSKVSS